MKKLLLVFSIIATFGIVVTASTITYSESTSEASSSIDFETNQMPQKKLHTLANASEHEFRFVPSGHGQAGEFTPNIY